MAKRKVTSWISNKFRSKLAIFDVFLYCDLFTLQVSAPPKVMECVYLRRWIKQKTHTHTCTHIWYDTFNLIISTNKRKPVTKIQKPKTRTHCSVIWYIQLIIWFLKFFCSNFILSQFFLATVCNLNLYIFFKNSLIYWKQTSDFVPAEYLIWTWHTAFVRTGR